MPRFDWGSAFSELGRRVPAIGESIYRYGQNKLETERQGRLDEAQLARDEETRKRNEVLNAISEIELEKKRREEERATGAAERLGEATKLMQPRIETIEGPPLPGKEFPQRMAPGMKPREALIKSGAAGYMEQPGVKEFAKTFEEKSESGAPKWQAQMMKDTPETKSRALDMLEQLRETGSYPDVNWDMWKNRILDDFAGAYQFNKVFTTGQTATGEALRKQDLMIPKKIKEAAGTSGARTKAKITTEKGEGKVLSTTASEKLGDFTASASQMNTLLTGLKNPNSPQGPIMQWKKINPYDWQAQGKQQLIASTKQLVGKALEGGVLRKEDEIKYEKILPKMGDTFKSAELKTSQIMTMLDNAYKAKLDAFEKSYYDVSQFPKSLQGASGTGSSFDDLWKKHGGK